ncbi:hypothetical protein BDN67DRAFT_1016259 [Paxillus ammoniavirescens]|nr:hypothetical protein BDN67DRAFT_1016259 [Paxillus ammoniavirescens]
MAAQQHADAMHNPSGKMVTPEDKPPSIWLEGESDNQPTPENPVGMQDGNEHCPNKPTEPPDEVKGARGGNGKGEMELLVENVETRVETVE